MSYFLPQPFDAAVNDIIPETPPPEVFAQPAAELLIIGRFKAGGSFQARRKSCGFVIDFTRHFLRHFCRYAFLPQLKLH
jgi:hypothetical protein